MLLNIKAYLPAILWAILILLLCLIPGKDIPNVPVIGLDKVIHFTLFGILSYLYFKISTKGNKKIIQLSTILGLCLIIFYGVLLEIVQGSYVAGRTADMYDGIANGLGVICTYLGYIFIKD